MNGWKRLVPADRQDLSGARRSNTRHCPQPLEQRALHGHSACGGIGPTAHDVDDENSVAVEPSLDGVQLDEGADEQRGRDDQDHRHRKLGDDERPAEAAMPVRIDLFECGIHVDAGRRNA